MLIGPLPEMRSASAAGAMLQKPRRGTIPRRCRSSSGIGEILTPSNPCDSTFTGALGKDSSARA